MENQGTPRGADSVDGEFWEKSIMGPIRNI